MAARLRYERQIVKGLVYATQYGAGISKIATLLNISDESAEKLRYDYFKEYPEFKNVSRQATKRAEKTGRVRLWSGRYKTFLKGDEYKAWNALMQGGGADIMERSLNRIVALNIPRDIASLKMTIHDSAVMQIRKGHENEIIPMVIDIMSNPKPTFPVKFAVDCHEWAAA